MRASTDDEDGKDGEVKKPPIDELTGSNGPCEPPTGTHNIDWESQTKKRGKVTGEGIVYGEYRVWRSVCRNCGYCDDPGNKFEELLRRKVVPIEDLPGEWEDVEDHLRKSDPVWSF